MTPELLIALAIGIAIGFAVEYLVMKKYGTVSNAEAAAKSLFASMEVVVKGWETKAQAEVASIAHKAVAATATPTAAPAPAPAPAPAVEWSLGQSYGSRGSLEGDFTGAKYTGQINIDGIPTYNVGAGAAVNFDTQPGGMLVQTKPA